jgi:hypothetical protein
MKLGDLLLYVSFLLIICAMIMFAYYSFTENVNECTSDPLKYGVEEIRDNYDATSVTGNIKIITTDGPRSWDFGDEFNIYNISLE